jgi:hypothetical protein
VKAPHLVRVEEEPGAFAALAEAIGAAGLRLGWLEWRAPEPLPGSLTAAAGLGALRAVAVGGGLSAAVKPIAGAPVLGDLLRQHFLGCALVLIHGHGGRGGETAGLPLLAPAGEGSYRLGGAGDERVLWADELAARLRSPRPLAGVAGGSSGDSTASESARTGREHREESPFEDPGSVGDTPTR